MLEKLKKAVLDYQPRMASFSADNNGKVIFQMLDCDEFDIGKIIFEKMHFLCIGTSEERFETIEAYDRHNIPVDFQFISPEALDENILIVLNGLSDYEDVSCLPILGKRRTGYVICRLVIYEKS